MEEHGGGASKREGRERNLGLGEDAEDGVGVGAVAVTDERLNVPLTTLREHFEILWEGNETRKNN